MDDMHLARLFLLLGCLSFVSASRFPCRGMARGYHPFPGNCRKFLYCSNHQQHVMTCPPLLVYNPEGGYCDYTGCQDANVKNGNGMKHFRPSVNTSQNAKFQHSLMSQIITFLDETRDTVLEQLGRQLREVASKAQDIPVYSRSAFNDQFLGNLGHAKDLSLPASFMLSCLQLIRIRFKLDKTEMKNIVKQLPSTVKPSGAPFVPGIALPTKHITTCPYAKNSEDNMCNKQNRYRTIDGSCNNLRRPLFGKSFVHLSRLLPADYDDGIEAPRMRGVRGRPLPGARAVSVVVHEAKELLSPMFTVMYMSLGQLIDHDIGRTAVTKLSRNVNGRGSLVSVQCGVSGCETEGAENEACLPIPIPEGDPDFPATKKCLKFVRTQPVTTVDCATGVREQLNQINSYIDASFVYGNTEDDAKKIRNLTDPWRGRLIVTPHPVNPRLRPLLPQDDHPDCRDVNIDRGIRCFTAGDGRVNEQIGLASLHTVFHRYHNYLENALHTINPHWNGETLYQEARRIVGAVVQVITYREYVPITLGPRLTKKYGLGLAKNGFHDVYDESVNADVSNSFQTAAFRFGHSQITDLLKLSAHNLRQFQEFRVSQIINRPAQLYNISSPARSGVDSVTLGMSAQSTEAVDRFFSREVTSKLNAENPPFGLGTDLAALNIQRGRDHGLPGYNEWREYCGLNRARDFDDLKEMSSKVREKFRNLYEHVDDLDLFTSGLAETRLPGAAVGPTFACIIGENFRNMKVGDRFWHEREDPLIGFSLAQLNEIRKITFFKVICNTLDRVNTIQKFVLLQPFSEVWQNIRRSGFDPYTLLSLYQGDRNERRPCHMLQDIDLLRWKQANH